MKKITKSLARVVLATLLLTSAGVRVASARDGRITCESSFNSYNYCRVDTNNRVRLVRRLSSRDCYEGSSWGYDSRGIWVDRGCRAEFEYGSKSRGGGISTGTGVAIAGAAVGAVVLAAILASRKKDSEKYNDPTKVYNLGLGKGAEDSRTGKSSDYARYRGKYDSNYDSDFIRGYNEGYRGRSSNSGNSGNSSRAYGDGYQRGIDDSIASRRSDYRRFSSQYNYDTENDFRRGYEDGYKNNRNTSFYRDDDGSHSSTVPNWLVGTFRGYTPSNRTYTDMTIYADGRVWLKATNGTAQSSGSYYNGVISFPWGNYSPDRNGGGFNARNMGNPGDNVFYARVY